MYYRNRITFSKSTVLAAFLFTMLVPFVLLTSGAAYAAGKEIAGLGTNAIVDPASKENSAWNGSYVYYGKYGGKPVLYRVLAHRTPDFSEDKTKHTMLLDCDGIFLNDKAFRANNDNQKWADSDVRKWLNETFFNVADFSANEKDAIALSNKGAGGCIGIFESVGLNNETIFLLDVSEVKGDKASAYGYKYDANRKKSGIDNNANAWWLRSPDDNVNDGYNRAGSVEYDGGVSVHTVNYAAQIGVSPAFNVSLSCVISATVVEGTAGEPGTKYKLTLLDSEDGKLAISRNGLVTRDGRTITVPYIVTGMNALKAQVSVILTNGEWEYDTGWSGNAEKKYYGVLSGVNGLGMFDLPDDYTSSWKAYIIAETVNGGTATDYASAPLEITVPRDIEAEKAKAEITRLIVGGFSALAALAALSLLLRKDKK